MTISSTARRAGPYSGNGSATSFAFTFKVFSTADIAVTVADADGIETVLVLDSDYSVTLNSNQETSPGGTVTYPLSGSPLPAQSRISIVGDLPLDQPLDLPAGGNFSPLALENELDRIVMQVQQLDERVDRSISLPVTSSASATLPVAEANKLIGWDQLGATLTNYSQSEIVTGATFGNWAYDTFTGTGSATAFALDSAPGSLGNMDVTIDGVTMVPLVDFSLSGSVITFTVAPANGAEILVRYGESLVQGGNTLTSERKVATASQTVFTLATTSYVPGGNNLAVYVNGVRLSPGVDFTETNSTTVTMSSGLALDDEVLFIVGGQVAEAVGASNVGWSQAGTGATARSVQDKLRESISVTDFGATGDGVTDDTAAIQAALDASEDRTLLFPAGTYLCGAVTISKQVQIVGDGAAATFIKASAATINVFTVTTVARVDVCDVTFSPAVTSTKQTAGAYLRYEPASGYNFGSRVRDCVFAYSYRGVQYVKAAGWSIEDCYFAWYRYGVEVANTDTPDAGDSTIRACVFDGGDATGDAVRQLSSGGLRLTNCKILNGSYGYVGEFNSNPNNTSVLLITGCSIERCATAGIALSASASTTFGLVVIEGNQFSVLASAYGILLSDPGFDYLDSVSIGGNLFSLGNSSTAMNIARGSRIALLPNTISGNGTNETGVTIGANVDSAVYYPQVIRDCTNGLTGSLSTTIFFAGLSLSGTVSTTTGTAYGSLYISAEQTVTFFAPFPVAPKVQATIASTADGGLSVSVYDVTTSGFKAKLIGLNNGGAVTANWFATV